MLIAKNKDPMFTFPHEKALHWATARGIETHRYCIKAAITSRATKSMSVWLLLVKHNGHVGETESSTRHVIATQLVTNCQSLNKLITLR